MHNFKFELMPEATQKNFARLKDDPRLAGFTLVGGTALALQIGHRMSEDLDFNIFGQPLPIQAIDGVLDDLAAGGAVMKASSLLNKRSDSRSTHQITLIITFRTT